MFGFFKKKKKKKQVQDQAPTRDLFAELFPLTAETKAKIDEAVAHTQKQMHGDDGFSEIRNYSRNYESKLAQLQSLEFDTFNWQLREATDNHCLYFSEYGDSLELAIVSPNGEMKKETAVEEMPIYRSWIRDLAVKEGGGLIYSEVFELENGLRGSETILKIPRKEETGMDYTYILNLHHYIEQKLYQVVFRVYEMSPTGMRDNIFLFPISQVVGSEVLDKMELYRQDPYDKNFTEGNTMNLSEREEFDFMFPFHPLSIIREEIAPQIKKSLKFLK